MLGHIYYSIGLIISFLILFLILKHNKIFNIRKWAYKFNKVTNNKPKKEDFKDVEEFNLFNLSFSIEIFDIFWIIFGLLTASWYIFGLVLILNLVRKLIFSVFEYSFFYKIFSLSFFFSKFLVYLYLIINHFHLHQDTYLLIKNLWL